MAHEKALQFLAGPFCVLQGAKQSQFDDQQEYTARPKQ